MSLRALLLLLVPVTLAACPSFGQPAAPKADPPLLGEDMQCRDSAGDSEITGVQNHAIAQSHWQWLRRTSSYMAAGTVGSHEMEVDPTVYYEAFIAAADGSALRARVIDSGGNAIATSSPDGRHAVELSWASNTQSHWKLEWGSAVGGCVYVLSTAKKK